MNRAKDKINQYGCNCGKVAASLEHNLTCPKLSCFLLSCPSEKVQENFARHYGKSVRVPSLDSVLEFGDKMAEMMQCNCSHWFPRWNYYRCPECQEGH